MPGTQGVLTEHDECLAAVAGGARYGCFWRSYTYGQRAVADGLAQQVLSRSSRIMMHGDLRGVLRHVVVEEGHPTFDWMHHLHAIAEEVP